MFYQTDNFLSNDSLQSMTLVCELEIYHRNFVESRKWGLIDVRRLVWLMRLITNVHMVNVTLSTKCMSCSHCIMY